MNKIKYVTLDHCINTFKNNEPEDDVSKVVELMNKLHQKRMDEVDDDEPMVITKEEFNNTVDKFEKKNKRSYNFLTRASDSFKNSVYKLCSRFIKNEEFPKRFFETVLHQLWKRKLPKEELNNHRFLHIKDWLTRCCEAMVVGKMKEGILSAGTKYQIGGSPTTGSRSTW